MKSMNVQLHIDEWKFDSAPQVFDAIMAGMDPYRAMAAQRFRVLPAAVTVEQRHTAKVMFMNGVFGGEGSKVCESA